MREPDKQKLELALIESVKAALETQFMVTIHSHKAGITAYDDIFSNSVLGANLLLQGNSYQVDLVMYVPTQAMKICMQNLLGSSDIDENDPSVLEGAGEFLNVAAGVFRKQLKSLFALELDMNCPENQGFVSITDAKIKFSKSSVCLFHTSIGDILFAFEAKITEISLKSAV